MGNYLEEKRKYDEAFDKALFDTGLFFAFDRKQFDEEKKPKNAADKQFVSLGIGSYIHKKNLPKYEDFMDNVAPALREDFLKKVSRTDLIKAELGNHECGYTQDYSEVVELVMGYYHLTEAEAVREVRAVFNKLYSS